MSKYEVIIENKKTGNLLTTHKIASSENEAKLYVGGFLNGSCKVKSIRLLPDKSNLLSKLFK